ncbi:CLUMA_CG015514, isoform A [Clunio marinus]|uniref:CLUMA_CG015514, isoform A n=1 Tax=Clunio marinus TaxID=568069 RepID=A0A1J1INX0_9DIPT|nr:CLUMA_CG015514, isoform A [Clunio marinus]
MLPHLHFPIEKPDESNICSDRPENKISTEEICNVNINLYLSSLRFELNGTKKNGKPKSERPENARKKYQIKVQIRSNLTHAF